MVFRRRRETDEVSDQDDQEGLDDIFDDDEDGEAAESSEPAHAPKPENVTAFTDEPYAVTARTNPTGPWDSHDVPKDDEIPRVDLGGIQVPVPDGVEVRVEVQDEIPVAATLVDGNTQLQVHAFAAPKSSGLWAEVRAEISQALKGDGGSADEAQGPFGTELRARLPAENGGQQPARFLGVDGPRWFLRGLLTGPGSTDPNQAKRLEQAFRDVVVNRGSDAMAPRDMLPLHLPREALDAAPLPDDPDHTLHLPERGPEITEIQ